MNIYKKMYVGTVVGVCALGAFGTQTADAASTQQISVGATVVSSATLTVLTNSGADSTLTFSGNAGATGLTATEGAAVVTAQVTTAFNNAPTITLEAPDFVGGLGSDAIPISNLSYTSVDNTVYANNFSTTANGAVLVDESGGLSESGVSSGVTVATLADGSGLYSFAQTFALALPQNVNADTYSTTLTYTIVGF